ncbi:MAG: hypothetical protein M3O22_00250 [Pseudomonadota bacterium]|nr:hypothetical protein [Pseudomonadota bacterium]
MAGRKRKEGAQRYPDGTVYRHEPAILPRTLEIRGATVGAENARNPKAGYLVGQWELNGKITPEQFYAACKAGYIWGMWEKILSRELGAPRRSVPCVQFYGASVGRSCDVIDEEKEQEIGAAAAEIDAVLKKHIRGWILAKAILDGVIMDNCLSPSMDPKRGHPFFGAHWTMFRNSLDVLAEHFGV